jgi:hypothetical protein
LKLRGNNYKSYADKFIPPAQFAKQHLTNLMANVGSFLKNDFHLDSGMKYLIESFYNSIREGSPLPIPYREILLTTRIMDEIFNQLETRKSQDQLVYQATPFQEN